MLHDVISVEVLADQHLRVRFDDGVEGVVRIAEFVRLRGVFEPLSDLAFFTKPRVDPELGVVCWPNGADLDSDVLYALVTRGVNLAARHN